jgi:endoglucanase
MRIILAALLASYTCFSTAQAAAKPDSTPVILWGINDSGFDFGNGAIVWRNYAIPDPGYYLQHGVRLVRIPFQIGRLQPVAGGMLAPDVVGYLKKIIAEDDEAGAITVLDPHGYGFFNIDGKPHDILTDPAAAADYVDFMKQLAVAFARDNVAIGLMNEPHTGDDAHYAKIWNQAIAVIRQSGFRGVILVPHAHWSSAADITPRTPFLGDIVDPDKNWILELHSYLDPDGTGTYRQPVTSTTIGVERLAGAIAWSRQSGIRLFLGETGAPPDAVGLTALQTMFNEIASAPDVFWGVAMWGGGAWWKPNYPMRLDPIDGVDRPQFLELEHMMTPEILYLAKDPGGTDSSVLIEIDGKEIGPAVTITTSRIVAPQAVPVRWKLKAGTHIVEVQPVGGGFVYVVGSTWKGSLNSADSFGKVASRGFIFKIQIPGS